ncbi:MAG: anthranilate synthase component I family protein [Acidimicrobiia bacterium]
MRLSDTVASTLLARLPLGSGAAAVRRGDSTLVGVEPAELVMARGPGAVACLDTLAPGFWVGWCAFELGHSLERVVPLAASTEPAAVPDVMFARFEALAAVDAEGRITVSGGGPGRALLELAAHDAYADAAATAVPGPMLASPLAPATWHSSLEREAYHARVEAILELLAAGECYQVNLTRRLTCAFPIDPVALYGALVYAHTAPHMAMLRITVGDRPVAVVSASPERYLQLRNHGQVESRPIKGTAEARAVLCASAKDRAENVIVVDLARNDLGRVCEPGSISVPSLCAVESHPGLHHLVSTVRGQLRPEVGIGALVAATFPPASVTGAPKPRVLQVIEELEPVRRGVYCGAFGWIDTRHAERGNVEADLAVAIRTFTILGEPGEDGACTQLGVGGGIVADSDPESEWLETELKASRLLHVANVPALVVT